MKSIPVTPELIAILEEALLDSQGVIAECDDELDHYTDNARKILISQIERKRQLQAIIKDLLERYKD